MQRVASGQARTSTSIPTPNRSQDQCPERPRANIAKHRTTRPSHTKRTASKAQTEAWIDHRCMLAALATPVQRAAQAAPRTARQAPLRAPPRRMRRSHARRGPQNERGHASRSKACALLIVPLAGVPSPLIRRRRSTRSARTKSRKRGGGTLSPRGREEARGRAGAPRQSAAAHDADRLGSLSTLPEARGATRHVCRTCGGIDRIHALARGGAARLRCRERRKGPKRVSRSVAFCFSCASRRHPRAAAGAAPAQRPPPPCRTHAQKPAPQQRRHLESGRATHLFLSFSHARSLSALAPAARRQTQVRLPGRLPPCTGRSRWRARLVSFL